MSNVIWDVTRGLPNAAIASLNELDRVAGQFDHPQALAVNAEGLLFAAGELDQLYVWQFGEGHVAEFPAPGALNAIVFDGDGAGYGSDESTNSVIRFGGGKLTTVSKGAKGRPFDFPSGLAFDEHGSLYVSDGGTANAQDGKIFRIGPSGETTLWCDYRFHTPNAIAWHPDGTHLYVVDSDLPGVLRIESLSDGSAGEVTIVVELPHNVPAGLAFDEARSLYIACHAPDVIYRLNFDGEITVLLSDWQRHLLNMPSSIVFAGPDRRHLLIANTGGLSIMSLEMPVSGVAPHFPILAAKRLRKKKVRR